MNRWKEVNDEARDIAYRIYETLEDNIANNVSVNEVLINATSKHGANLQKDRYTNLVFDYLLDIMSKRDM